MDEGRPFRVPQSADRRGVNRPEPARRPPEAPQPVMSDPQPAPRAPMPPREEPKKDKSFGRFMWPLAVVVVLAIAGSVWWFGGKSAGLAVDGGKYQAVFFTNGNVYFGKLQQLNGDYYKMTNVYYPQTQANDKTGGESQQQAANQSNITLLKLSDAIHGPDNEMMIAKDQVQFYQNLRSDSKVSQLIDQQKGSN